MGWARAQISAAHRCKNILPKNALFFPGSSGPWTQSKSHFFIGESEDDIEDAKTARTRRKAPELQIADSPRNLRNFCSTIPFCFCPIDRLSGRFTPVGPSGGFRVVIFEVGSGMSACIRQHVDSFSRLGGLGVAELSPSAVGSCAYTSPLNCLLCRTQGENYRM